MKKQIATMSLILICVFTFAQRFEKSHYGSPSNYKKHYSHNIEGGTVDGIQREFVIGNNTDYLTVNYEVFGQSVTGNIIGSGVRGYIAGRIALTDFAVLPSSENQYAVGTGIYYPDGPGNLTGYPFMGIYDRKTMIPINLYYYYISYPSDHVNKNSAGLRIKYNKLNNSVYISGILCDNVFPQMNMNDLVGKSQGFILKIDFANPGAGQALVFDHDDLAINPILCAVTDIEINETEQEIAFTGINTKQTTAGFYSPFAGKIDMNLNILWSKTYSFGTQRYSGIDVEYTNNGDFLMLMNCDKYDFAIMEINNLGTVLQEPAKYTFNYNDEPWPARSHILHYSDKGEIIVTGNLFVAERDQHLYSYKIPIASNLLSGESNFSIYSKQVIPQGKQVEVTNYWAPENSILSNDDLSIVGIYNNLEGLGDEFGFSLIHAAGFDFASCGDMGDVKMESDISKSVNCSAHQVNCKSGFQIYFADNLGIPDYNQECPSHKSIKIDIKEPTDFGWKVQSTSESGIVLNFVNGEQSNYVINVYTASGVRVHSENVSVNGENTVFLNFKTSNQLYLVNVSNGIKSETRKVTVIQ